MQLKYKILRVPEGYRPEVVPLEHRHSFEPGENYPEGTFFQLYREHNGYYDQDGNFQIDENCKDILVMSFAVESLEVLKEWLMFNKDFSGKKWEEEEINSLTL